MHTYRIKATSTHYYDFSIEANSEVEAIEKVRHIENSMSIDDFIDGYSALDITEINVE